MTENASAVEEIVQSLSFEVVAIPDKSQKIVPNSTTKATPLNIKVKVKKKHEGGLRHGVLATPFKSPDEVPQRIRLVSSDQTIMSFNAVMEDIDFDKSRTQKPNLPSIDNHPYTPSKTEAYQPQGTLKNKLPLYKVEHNSNKKKDIFGRCKPGGCLDPPFGEDKYSYEPSKQQLQTEIQDAPERKRTSSIFSNKLFKKINKTKTSKGDVKKDQCESNQSVTSLYQTGSLQTANSNSLITYPSSLNGSDDKVIKDRQKSPRNSATAKSTESDNSSLYIVPKKTRASLENAEAKLKSKGDDKHLDLSEKLENADDLRKLDDSEKRYNSAVNNLDEQHQDQINKTNYEEQNTLCTEPQLEKYRFDELIYSPLESKQDDTKDNATIGVKTGFFAAGATAATVGIAATLRSNLKDSNETTSDSLVDKLSDNDNEDTKVDDDKQNKTISNDNEDNIRFKYFDTIQHQNDVNKKNFEAQNMLCTESKVEEYGSDKLTESTSESNQDNTRHNTTTEIIQGIAAGVTAATVGIAATLRSDLKDNNETTSYSLVDKLSDKDNADLNIDDCKTNKTISNDNGENINETVINKTEQGNDGDDGTQVSSNTTDYKDSNVNKHEDIGYENGIIISNEDLSKDPQSGITQTVMGDANRLINEAEDFGTDKLVSKDSGNINNMPSADLGDKRELSSKIISSLYSSNKIDTQVSKDTNIEEYDKENQNIISIRGDTSDKTSDKNDDDNIVSVFNNYKNLQDILEKGKEIHKPEETNANIKTPSELREYAFDYKDMDLKQSEKNVNNNEQNNTSNDVVKTDIFSDRLGHNNDLSENLSKRHQIQPGSSESESFKEKKTKKAADGDKQKKPKESAAQFKAKINLGFHIYKDENNELTLKTFDSRTPTSRYPEDSVIVANCDLNPFELKAPFGTEQYLWIQIKDNENLTKLLPDHAESSQNSPPSKQQKPNLHKVNEMNSAVKNATKAVKLINKDIVKAQMKNIYGTYENELLPLKKSLTRLKQDVDVLILHQRAIRNNLLTKKFTMQGKRKCGCVMKL